TGQPQDELNLDVYVPIGGQEMKPVVVYVHGGSWRAGDKKNTGLKDEFFTDLDYVFVSVNYRLSPNPIDLDDEDRIKFPDHPQDLARALAWVFENIHQYGGDSRRVALLGHSAGAHLVSLVGTDESYLQAEGLSLDQIKCVCSLDAGAYDIPYYLDTYAPPGSNQYFNYQNAFGSERSDWESASPISHIEANKNIPDFMIVHQGTSQRVDLANNFGSALEQAGIPTTYLNAAPLDHENINGLLGSDNPALEVYNDSIADFFQTCLFKTVSSIAYFQGQSIEISTFPNPFHSECWLSVDEALDVANLQLQLLDSKGEILTQWSPQGFLERIKLDTYPNGMYLLKITYQNQIWTQKLIKN
ncbi:MAG: carboxylesterase family protein, partial [Bacteroidota bacterium]